MSWQKGGGLSGGNASPQCAKATRSALGAQATSKAPAGANSCHDQGQQAQALGGSVPRQS